MNPEERRVTTERKESEEPRITAEQQNKYTNKINQELTEIFSSLDKLLSYEPADFEFSKTFDKDTAVHILSEICSIDNFFINSMEYYEPYYYSYDTSVISFEEMDNRTLFTLLLWLKWYVNKRRIATSELRCYILHITAESYRNLSHKSYILSSPLTCNSADEIIMTPYRLLVQRDFILPETIFFAKGNNILTLGTLLNLMSMYSNKTLLLDPLIDNDVLSIVPKLNRVLSNRYFSTPDKSIVIKIKQSIDNIISYIPDHKDNFDYPDRSRSELIMTSAFLAAFISMM